MSVAQHIFSKLESIPKGIPFTPKEFLNLGSRHNIDKVLERLVKQGKVRRVLRGVYVCPEFSKYVGEVPPSLHEVVKAIAASTGEVLQLHGAEAVRQLGLSTQVPVKPVYLTSGRSRTILIENIEVEFRHVSPKKLILTGTQAGLAITALWYLGKNIVTIETIAKIKQQIRPEEFEIFLENKQNMPEWMARAVIDFEQK
jgi:hypothetical protein